MRSTLNALLVIFCIIGVLVGILQVGMSIIGHGKNHWSSGLVVSLVFIVISVIMYFLVNLVFDLIEKKKN